MYVCISGFPFRNNDPEKEEGAPRMFTSASKEDGG